MTPAQPHPEEIIRLGRYLTVREFEVLALIAEGLTNTEIGIALEISRETVKSHVRHAMARMGCRSRAEMVNIAWKRGLLPADENWIEHHLSLLSTRLYGSE